MSARDEVLAVYPQALAVCDREFGNVYILSDARQVDDVCPCCRQSWTHMDMSGKNNIGCGLDEESAWEDAARSVKTMKSVLG